jgi:UDP-N-acetylmuramoyl-L-alanyl-D-glutamate--2,6-diaminopimelate ligase
MRFADLIAGLDATPVDAPAPAEVTGVCRDSRLVAPGQAYVAMGPADGQAAHVAEALQRGATVILTEAAIAVDTGPVPRLTVGNARAAFARMSAAAHGLDHRCPPLVAAVGTAGKSTTVHCTWWAMGAGAARIGTIGWHDGVSERPNPQTTPPPEQLHAFLAGLPADCPGAAMEVSSHACDQRRCEGLRFAAIAFTGIGHDHLDYHRTMESYVAAKLSSFRWLVPGGLVVVNAEDPRCDLITASARGAGARVLGLGFRSGAALVTQQDGHWTLAVDGTPHVLPVRLPGSFNAWNAAAGALLARATGVPLAIALNRLADLPPVPGRLELLARRPDTYVDYAHTPDEIATMLTALRHQFPGRRLVCVFGCGGDRDRTKRGPMGRAALTADMAVLTTDNSRSEAPEAIAQDVLSGLPDGALASGRMVVEHDRAAAIRLGRDAAGPDGIAVVAGKGHETDQLIQGRILPWDDRAFVRSLAQDDAP